MSVLFLQITITHKWVLLCKLHALDRCLCVCFFREWVWGSIGRRMLRTCAIACTNWYIGMRMLIHYSGFAFLHF